MLDFFTQLLESAPDALVIVDTHGDVVLTNRQAERLFGYPRTELLGRPVEMLVPERFRARHAAQRASYFSDPHVRPISVGLDFYGLGKDGSEFPVEISLSPLQTEKGLLVISAIRDVSARKETEARLRKLEARYRTLVEGIPAVTFLAALDGPSELYVSPQIEQLLGFSQREWLSDPTLWEKQLHPDDRRRWHTEFAHTCATSEPFCSVYRFLARDGRVVWVQGEARMAREADGTPLFLQGVAFDITPLKQAEAQLKALNLTLEQRVAERTAVAEHRANDLARSNAALEQQAQELREVNQALVRSNQELDDFAYIASHDLKEPLRGIASYAQFLIEDYADRLDADGRAKLQTLERLSQRLSDLIDSLHEYARLGRVQMAVAPADLNEVLAGVLDGLHITLEQQCVAVRVPRPLPTLPCDRVYVGEVFHNLITNAVKYNDRSQKWVEVGWTEAAAPGRPAALYVSDNGIGIREKHLQAIFRIFKRLHGRDQYSGGTGVGLTLAKRIVERHGGHIWVESTHGEGTTFRFTLERTESDHDDHQI